MDTLYNDCQRAEQDLQIMVDNAGLVILPTSIAPFISLEDAEKAVIPRERILDLITSVKKLLPPDALRVGLFAASCQVSVDYKDADDLYKKLHRGHASSPLLISTLASDTGRMEGNIIPHHIRAGLYDAYGENVSGLPGYYDDCQNGDQLISSHLDQVCNTPLLYYYEGENVIYPSTLTETFNTLAKKGLDTERNFETAESFLYHDIKLKPLPNGKRRLEFRLPDTGLGHMNAASALISVLVCHQETAPIFDSILKRFGFHGNIAADKSLLESNRINAIRNPGDYNVGFGSGTMKDVLSAIRAEILPRLNHSGKTAEILLSLLDGNREPLTMSYRRMNDAELKNAMLRARLKK